jgi:hypothetical protein
MRMDIIIGTRFGDNGSRAVYLPGGDVVGKMRIIPFSRKLDVTDRLVSTIRGKTLVDTDLVGILRILREYAVSGEVVLYSRDDRIVFDVRHPPTDKADGLDREIIEFDAQKLLPLLVNSYTAGRLVQHFVFSDYILDAGLPVALFNVRYDPENLIENGIRTIAVVPVREADLLESRFPGN